MRRRLYRIWRILRANAIYEAQRAYEIITDPDNTRPGSGRGRRYDGRPSKCSCGWYGPTKEAKHTYWRGFDPDDVELVDECPDCRREVISCISIRDEIEARIAIIDNWLDPDYLKKKKRLRARY